VRTEPAGTDQAAQLIVQFAGGQPLSSTLERMSPLPASSTLAFAEVARAFCAWCEGPSLGKEKEGAVAFWLAKLYVTTLELPKVESVNAEGLPNLPEAALATTRANLGYFNGCYYREFFDPDPALVEEPVMGDIGDDLLDIYKDIKAGCLLFDRGEAAVILASRSLGAPCRRRFVCASLPLHFEAGMKMRANMALKADWPEAAQSNV
jgi:hypothetical protein